MSFRFAMNPGSGSFIAPISPQPNYLQMLTNLRSGPLPGLPQAPVGLPQAPLGLGGLLNANPQLLMAALQPRTAAKFAPPLSSYVPAPPIVASSAAPTQANTSTAASSSNTGLVETVPKY